MDAGRQAFSPRPGAVADVQQAFDRKKHATADARQTFDAKKDLTWNAQQAFDPIPPATGWRLLYPPPRCSP